MACAMLIGMVDMLIAVWLILAVPLLALQAVERNGFSARTKRLTGIWIVGLIAILAAWKAGA